MESAMLRAQKLQAKGKGANATAMSTVFAHDSLARIESAARNVIAACTAPESLSEN
jgi:hypothetical protein